VLWLLVQEQNQGPFNITAPTPVRNTEFTRSFARSLHRPTLFSMPACILKLILGKRAYLLLDGQHAPPDNLGRSGFQFKYENLDAALNALNNRL
jgi:NAD dependent epimerase/dehydratase family enzyme